ncbi:hypothetical protein GCK72_014934 [Caenorhabditis remanei]|uniref:Uncharacterized protein n=1 Tax=Caenorhabditis remanei TaxID=31234 RepID=A0A6A5GV36_CAERE|nr:hypothetical protein GCK72_014934 [Caenorhabditis remanei]KAF1758476.1 hypothetical protein GCK72_014934 [Caenorhabditis remanei]
MIGNSSSGDGSQEKKSFLDKPNSSKTANSAVTGASEKSNKTEKSSKKTEQKTDRSVKSTKTQMTEKTTNQSMVSQKSTASTQSMGRRGPKMSDGTEFDTGPYGYIFSFIYLAVLWGLAIILAILLVYFNYSRLDPQFPTYFGHGSFLGGVPKATFDPNPRRFLEEGNINVMEWNIYEFKSYLNYLIRYKQLLKKYSGGDTIKTRVIGKGLCSNQSLTVDKSCQFDRFTGFGECVLSHANLEHGFGFSKGQPCIMLRLNKIVGWAPILSNQTECDDGDLCCGTGIQFECKSNDDVQFEYYPKTGIPSCYFPYANQRGYEQPYQMVKLANISFNTPTTIECYPKDSSLRTLDSGKVNEARFHIKMTKDTVDEKKKD